MRWLFLLLVSGLSLALCVVTVVVWLRDHDFSHIDRIEVRGARVYGIYSMGDELYFAKMWNPAHLEPVPRRFLIGGADGWGNEMNCYSAFRWYGRAAAGFGIARSDPPASQSIKYPSVRIVIVPDWSLTALLALISAIGWLRLRVTVVRLRRGQCQTCGYDLRASRDRCPECGTPIPNRRPGARTPD